MGSFRKKAGRLLVFPRLSLPPARARRRPLPGTGTLPDAGGSGGGGHAPRHPPARIRRSRPELPQAGKREARGRESGTSWRVSPRTADPSNAPAVEHARASSRRLGTGEGERKCEGVFPQKSGKSRSYFRGSHSRGPAPAADPYPAPAPCRTQGVRGAADTPPASHEFAPCLPRVRPLPPTSSPPASHEFATCLPRVRHRPSTSSPPAFHGLAPLPPTGPRPPYPRCQKPEYMVLRYCMGDIPVWRRKIR